MELSGINNLDFPAVLQQEVNVLYFKGGNYAHNGFSRFLEQLGCKVTTVTSEGAFFECYNETQLNAFNIFGGEKFHCMIFDVFSSSQKVFGIVQHLRDKYPKLPPMIALTTPEQSLTLFNLKQQGFDEAIAFPMPAGEFMINLIRWIGIENPALVAHKQQQVNEKMDNYPVISLKTYSHILAQTEKNGFSLLPLYKEFMLELDSHMHDFIEAYENNNRAHYESIILSIRGLCATMGATQMYQLSNDIDSFSRNNQAEHVGSMIPFLIEKYLILKEYIMQWQKDQPIIAA